MSLEVQIRPAIESDIPAITAIYRHHVLGGNGTFEIDAPDEGEITSRWQAVMERGYPWLVAEKDGGVIGYAYAGPFRARAAYRFTLEDSIYVHPDSMRRGLGKALLQELIEASRRGGFRQIIAVIGDSGNTGSIRLHESCGFQHTGVLKNVGLKFDRWLDVVLMQLEL